MLNQSKLLFKSIALIIFACLFTSCNDSKTGIDPEKSPNIPQLHKTVLTPDLSYFKIDSSIQPESNFQQGKAIIQKATEKFNATKKFYKSFLAPTISEKPVFKDGKWFWSYKNNKRNFSQAQLTLTASKNKSNIIWQLFYSNTNNKVKDQKILHGSSMTRKIVNNKFNSASWQIYPSTDSTLVLRYRFKSLNSKSVHISKPSAGSKVSYRVSTPNHRIIIRNIKKDYEVKVNWNTKTGTGYVVINKKKMCWDANYQNIQC